MPRLGGDEAGPRHEAAAYEGIHRRNNNPFQIRTILIILTLTLILRNLLFTDYRSQQIGTLRASGKTQEEIDAIVPKTSAELRQEYQNKKMSVTDMQSDIAFLLQEVKELRQNVAGNSTVGDKKLQDGTGQGALKSSRMKPVENKLVVLDPIS